MTLSEIRGRMNDDVFAHLGEAAEYYPVDGPRCVVTVTERAPTAEVTFFSTGAHQPSLVLKVRSSEVGEPVEGDKVLFRNVTYLVRSAVLDTGSAVWTLDLDLHTPAP